MGSLEDYLVNYRREGPFYVFMGSFRIPEGSELSIVFEGIDGSGKDTQIYHLLNYLAERGISHSFIAYPDKERAARDNPEFLEYIKGKKSLEGKIQMGFYMKQFADDAGLNMGLRKRGFVDIKSRYCMSTYAYQGKTPELRELILSKAEILPRHDAIFFINISPEASVSRKKGEVNEGGIDRQRELKEGYMLLKSSKDYLAIADKWVNIPGERAIKNVHADVKSRFKSYLLRKAGTK